AVRRRLNMGADPEREPAPAQRRHSLGEIVKLVVMTLGQPGAPAMVVLIATYKAGETIIEAMFKPLLVDAGYAAERIGLLVGTYGMAASIVGSIAGGYLATRAPLYTSMLACAVLRLAPMVGQLHVALGHHGATEVTAVVCAEHLFGGALTTVTFAWMMSRV